MPRSKWCCTRLVQGLPLATSCWTTRMTNGWGTRLLCGLGTVQVTHLASAAGAADGMSLSLEKRTGRVICHLRPSSAASPLLELLWCRMDVGRTSGWPRRTGSP